MRRIGALFLFVLFLPDLPSFALTLEWERNSETDMKDYRVFACNVPGCIVSTLSPVIGTVLQSSIGVKPTLLLPPGLEGRVGVTARDTSNNESELSVTIPFDSKSPNVPSGIVLK